MKYLFFRAFLSSGCSQGFKGFAALLARETGSAQRTPVSVAECSAPMDRLISPSQPPVPPASDPVPDIDEAGNEFQSELTIHFELYKLN